MVFIKEQETTLKKQLSLLDLIVFGIGSTIGAGIFILIGLGASITGPGIIVSFILGTLISLFIALNYAELSTSIPTAGGSYSFVKEGLGGIIAFYVGWLIWLGSVVYSALSTVGFVQYLNYIYPLPFQDLIGILILIGFAFLNMKSFKKAMMVQKIITLILLAIFIITIVTGSMNFDVKKLSPLFPKGIPSIFVGTSLIFVCFIGFAMLTTVSEEAKEPKNIGIALIASVLISGLIYIGISIVTIGSVPIDVLINSKAPLMELVKDNSILTGFMLLAAILATLSSLNVSLVAASRNLFALSRDGYVPKIFSSIQRKYKTPHIAMLFSALMAVLFVASRSIDFIAYLSSFGYIFAFSLVSCSLFILRKKRKYLERPFKVPFYKFFSLVGFAVPLILILFLESSAIFTGIVWMIIGFFVYCLHTLGVDRFRMAFGGINILISILSFTVWYSLKIGFSTMGTSPKILISYTSLIIGVICLITGILFMKKIKIPKKEEKVRI